MTLWAALDHVAHLKLSPQNIDDSTVAGIISEVDISKTSSLHFEDFLDVCAALKDVRLENAFTGIVKEVEEGGFPKRNSDPLGPAAQERSARRDERRKIPAERSGGGW